MKPVNTDDPLRTTDHSPESAVVQPTESFTPDAETGVAADADGTRTYHPGVDDSPTAAVDRPMPSIPGYIYAMVKTKPSLILHRPVTIDDRNDEKAGMEAADAH